MKRKEAFITRADGDFYLGDNVRLSRVIPPSKITAVYDPALSGGAVVYCADKKLYKYDSGGFEELAVCGFTPAAVIAAAENSVLRLAVIGADGIIKVISGSGGEAAAQPCAAGCYFINRYFLGKDNVIEISEPFKTVFAGRKIVLPGDFGGIRKMLRYENVMLAACERGAWVIKYDGVKFTVHKFGAEFLTDSLAVCNAGFAFCTEAAGYLFDGKKIKKAFDFPDGVRACGAHGLSNGVYAVKCRVRENDGVFFYDLKSGEHYAAETSAELIGGNLISAGDFCYAAGEDGNVSFSSKNLTFGGSSLKKITSVTVCGEGVFDIKITGDNSRSFTAPAGKTVYPRVNGRSFKLSASGGKTFGGIKIYYYETGGGL